MNHLPTLSIGIPTYNEANTIENIILCFLGSSYPNLVEILIADGGSTDGTQDIVENFSHKSQKVVIKLFHNPLKIQSAGLNLLIHHAQGDVFLRADAHSDYADDYVECCIETLIKSNALNVGGAQRFVAKTSFQSGISLAVLSPLGSGGAKYRNSDFNGYADTVYLGCFWRNALLDLGLKMHGSPQIDKDSSTLYTPFDLSQITNQDAELNLRLIETNHNAIYISSNIRTWYYPRSSWKLLFLQYFKYGRGRFLTNKKHNSNLLSRGNLPFLAFSLLFLLLLLSIIFPAIWPLFITILILALFIFIVESTRITLLTKSSFHRLIWRNSIVPAPSLLLRWWYCLLVLFTMPFAHFLGMYYQLYRVLLLRKKLW